MEPFQYLEHTADVKFRARGHSLEEMFGNSALAMFNAMTDTSKVKNRETWTIELESESLEGLLYEWLSELLYLFDVELALFASFEVELAQVGSKQVRPEQAGKQVGSEQMETEQLGPTQSDSGTGSEGWKLKARVGGERIDPKRHFFETEVKAVTLHQFEVAQEENLWIAQVILDV